MINPNSAFKVFLNQVNREHTFNYVAGQSKKHRKQKEQLIEFID